MGMIEHLKLMEEKKLGIEYPDTIFEISKVFIRKEDNTLQEYTNVILGLLKNPHHFGSLNKEIHLKNLLHMVAEIFNSKIEIQVHATKMNLINLFINNKPQGYVEFFEQFILCEISNLESFLGYNNNINKYKIKNLPLEEFTIRDYSFPLKDNFQNLEQGLKKIHKITYSLFDVFKDSFGIRIKYFDIKKENEVLNLFKSLSIELR